MPTTSDIKNYARIVRATIRVLVDHKPNTRAIVKSITENNGARCAIATFGNIRQVSILVRWTPCEASSMYGDSCCEVTVISRIGSSEVDCEAARITFIDHMTGEPMEPSTLLLRHVARMFATAAYLWDGLTREI